MKRQVTYSEHPTRATRRAHAAGDRQFRTYDTSAINPRRRGVAPTLFAIVLLLLAIGAAWFFLSDKLTSCTADTSTVPAGTQVAVVVPDGASVTEIARTLKDARLIPSVDTFTKAVKAKGAEATLKPGAYTIEGGMGADQIIALLQAGPVASTFTIPEGFTVARVAALVEEAYGGQITADEFFSTAANASAFAEEFPFVAGVYYNSLEGFLFPKTYEMAPGDTADSLIRRMLAQYQAEVANLDYSYAESRGLSAYDVLKLASIIEREAAEDNRALVSSVFYNRMGEGMPLQSDATIAYLVNRDPTPEDLEMDSPYNTYLNTGLTPGPICSPGLAALQAACAPEESDYYYFYFAPDADGTMVYSFSRTYDEHQAVIEQDQ